MKHYTLRILKPVIILIVFFCAPSLKAHNFKILLKDSLTHQAIENAVVYTINQKNPIGSLSNSKGEVEITLLNDTCKIAIQHINYKTVQAILINKSYTQIIFLSKQTQQLQDIVVTARETKAMTSTSQIDQQAMQHLQPNSIADIFSLLPGGSKQHASMTSSQTASLRETGTSSEDYAISALGTSFVIDGTAVNTDANLQYVAQRTGLGEDKSRSTVNRGVDMRRISTDDIEKIEITRGIASVEYGELTSGLVKIKRKQKASKYHVRLKQDGFTQLAYLGKGFTLKDSKDYLNFSIDFLNSRRDPRSSLENYKRFNTSLRYTHHSKSSTLHYKYYTNLNYSGSFDNEKQDAEIQKHPADYYQSSYHRLSWNNQFTLRPIEKSFYQQLTLSSAFSYAKNTIEQRRFVSLTRDQAMPISNQEGEHDGIYLPYKYIANYKVDGQPFYATFKAIATGDFKIATSTNHWKIGSELNVSKNFGKGQVFDPHTPLSPSTSSRPRPYYSIPSKNLLSAFIEDKISLSLSEHTLHIRGGLRASGLLGLPTDYTMHHQIYLEPRINLDWELPNIMMGDAPLHINFTTGMGKQSKLPTLAQLYPADIYYDVIQMNYYHMNPDYKRLNLKTVIINPKNPKLQAATNNKWEIRTQISWKKYHFSISYFYENMTDGFRKNLTLMPLSYKDYDETQINHATLSGPPDLATVPYQSKKTIQGYNQFENGSRITKKGIEFQFSSPRIKGINTRVTINGAWFQTTYVNSKPQFYYSTSKVINDLPVNDHFVGYYDWQDGYQRELLNTNIIFDTYFKKLGLNFSTHIQIHGYNSDKRLSKNGTPIAYMDVEGKLHPYTSQDQKDALKQWLTIKVNNALFTQRRVTPIAAYLNFKATKEIGQHAKIAFFIDKLFDYLPDYKGDNGDIIRRSSSVYFGMELNLSL